VRVQDVDVGDVKVSVCVYVFDVLYFDGASLVTLPYRDRRQTLTERFSEKPGVFQFATSSDTVDHCVIEYFKLMLEFCGGTFLCFFHKCSMTDQPTLMKFSRFSTTPLKVH
jgi:DNA ligase-1